MIDHVRISSWILVHQGVIRTYSVTMNYSEIGAQHLVEED
uniref:Uncharacterized protein n=1 Tax=viral metagenome TaxID=1070528 RepID=A0A6C0BL49_9ZZZZ